MRKSGTIFGCPPAYFMTRTQHFLFVRNEPVTSLRVREELHRARRSGFHSCRTATLRRTHRRRAVSFDSPTGKPWNGIVDVEAQPLGSTDVDFDTRRARSSEILRDRRQVAAFAQDPSKREALPQNLCSVRASPVSDKLHSTLGPGGTLAAKNNEEAF